VIFGYITVDKIPRLANEPMAIYFFHTVVFEQNFGISHITL